MIPAVAPRPATKAARRLAILQTGGLIGWPILIELDHFETDYLVWLGRPGVAPPPSSLRQQASRVVPPSLCRRRSFVRSRTKNRSAQGEAQETRELHGGRRGGRCNFRPDASPAGYDCRSGARNRCRRVHRRSAAEGAAYAAVGRRWGQKRGAVGRIGGCPSPPHFGRAPSSRLPLHCWSPLTPPALPTNRCRYHYHWPVRRCYRRRRGRGRGRPGACPAANPHPPHLPLSRVYAQQRRTEPVVASQERRRRKKSVGRYQQRRGGHRGVGGGKGVTMRECCAVAPSTSAAVRAVPAPRLQPTNRPPLFLRNLGRGATDGCGDHSRPERAATRPFQAPLSGRLRWRRHARARPPPPAWVPRPAATPLWHSRRQIREA